MKKDLIITKIQWRVQPRAALEFVISSPLSKSAPVSETTLSHPNPVRLLTQRNIDIVLQSVAILFSVGIYQYVWYFLLRRKKKTNWKIDKK